jgi:hypothetical protein
MSIADEGTQGMLINANKEKRVAVVTDTTNSGFHFPRWYKYYSEQFGPENLFVFTSSKGIEGFRSIKLGGLWHVNSDYNDSIRARTMSAASSLLLTDYDWVVRVDVDEFLVPDLRHFRNLREYVLLLKKPYVTARGYNLYEAPDDPKIDETKPLLLAQRRFARAETAMNKTCITSVPIDWGLGFHFCSVHPVLDEIYLLHLKRAHLDMLVEWSAWMLPQVRGDKALEVYYQQSREKYVAANREVLLGPPVNGWEAMVDAKIDGSFLESIVYDAANKRYRGAFNASRNIVMLPDEFEGVF